MRLDHLLSKENIVYFCFVAGWVLVSALLVTSFLSLRVLRVVARFLGGTSAARGFCACGGISETRMSVFVFGF